MKWIVLPLAAALSLGWSGFLDRLEATTRAAAALARTSQEAPQTTGRAAREVAALPEIAELTTRQAEAFEVLGDALQVSARRVFRLNESLKAQAGGIDDIVGGIEHIEGALGCVGRRLRGLLEVSRRVPPNVRRIRSILVGVEQTQRKSIRHLKSINRKLTALGAAARATDVKAPPRPKLPEVGLPRGEADPIACNGYRSGAG